MLRLRILTRLRRHRLDRQLAEGADPNASPALRERSRQLLSDEGRCQVATGLQGFLDDAFADSWPPSSRVPIAREAIRDSRWDIEEVVERLTAPAYLCPQGVARLSILMTDGNSPLFGPSTSAQQLRWGLVAATEALDNGPLLVSDRRCDGAVLPAAPAAGQLIPPSARSAGR
jgi:hypothetical protein